MSLRRPIFVIFLAAAVLSILALFLVSSTKTAHVPQQSSPSSNKPLTLDFPRLGMWWPDPWEQPLKDIARYDWVILGDIPQFIAPLQNLNPDIILLNSTNACEINFNPSPKAQPWENKIARKVASEWFLTQVGSTLKEPVDKKTTTFHVAAVTAQDKKKVYKLFVPGDTALIDDEIVKIKAVNKKNNTLTVRRGYVRPASSHQAGVRIASLITYWPGSWLMDVSTFCPAVTVDKNIGPETWAQFNARLSAEMTLSADWDGILVDRSDKDESWLIGNSTARTIDRDRSNRLRTNYSKFDRAWNKGLRQFLSDLRNRLGPDRIIYLNWGIETYRLVNGNNFEGFPMDVERFPMWGLSFGQYWHELVFGPSDRGSYFEWITRARQPNLTMIETYEDDGGPDPKGNLRYENPCKKPGFKPDYRKMRLGLATSLLNDGFFSYEINTNGHGSLCLMWFDEYDSAGKGRGYLGQPLGPAYHAVPELSTPNLVGDGTFETMPENWNVWWHHKGYQAEWNIDSTTAAEGNSSIRIKITETAGVFWKVSLSAAPIEIKPKTEYTLTFWAKSDHNHPLFVWVQKESPPWTDYIFFTEGSLSTEWKKYEFLGMPTKKDKSASLYFGLGETTGTVWIDDVRLQEGNHNVWRRDFEHGIALVNATSIPQCIILNDTFQKIQGTQDPKTNDGSLVNQVTIPAYDGLVLLRVKGNNFSYNYKD